MAWNTSKTFIFANVFLEPQNVSDAHNTSTVADSVQTTEIPEVSPVYEDTFDGIITEKTLRLIETVVNGGILPVLVLFGFAGNVTNMVVFVRQGLGDRINVCLFCLAITDTGFLLSHMASRTFVVFNLFDTNLGAYWQARAFSLTGVYLGFLLTSNSITLVIALQRCIIVVSPLSAKRLPSAKQMAVVLGSLFAVCMAGTGAYCFKWEPSTETDPNTNVTQDVIKVTDFYLDNRRVFDIIVEICFNVFVPVTSLVVVIAANVIITVRMRSVLAWRKDTAHVGSSQQQPSASANQREAAMTKMLLVVCVVYSVCTTPTACQAVGRVFVAEFVAGGRYNNTFYALLCVSHLLESINCSVNFIIYYTMSSRFKETLKEMLRKKGERKGKEKFTSRISSVGSISTVV